MRYDRGYPPRQRADHYPERTNFRAGPPRTGWAGGYDGVFRDPGRAPGGLPHRVTARYNLDYVVGYRSDPYDRRNYNMYTGDRMERMGDPRYYRRPYLTIGGTRTSRGSNNPIGYDFPYQR